MKVGLIGLGAMGLPMGRRLLGAGHDLYVVPHVRREPAVDLAAAGAQIVDRASELTGECAVVLTSVPDVPQVQEVLFGEHGLDKGSGKGLLFIDLSTINPTAAREHHRRLAELGIDALDAPVSGGPTRASDGTLTIMVGGSKEAFERAQSVLTALGSHVTHVGDSGAGQAVKLVNQLMISIIMIANAEALTLGVKAGVPLETLTEVIGTASGSNYLMQSWLPRTLFAGDLGGGFALDLLMKDLSASVKWAADMGVPIFAGAVAQQLYRLAQAEGAGKLDYSAVAQIYEKAAGLELRTNRGNTGGGA